MELFWVLILSELFPEDRKMQDGLRISSCVNSSVGTSLPGISLVFLFMAVLLAGCGAPLQFAGPILLALFPLLIFASSIWVGCSQGQRLPCHLCTASYSKTPQIFLQVLLVNKVKLKNHGSTGVPPEMCSHTTYLPIAVETQEQKWNLNKTSVKNLYLPNIIPIALLPPVCFLYYSLWGFISFTAGQILSTPNRLIDLTLLALFPYLLHLKCMEWGILQGIQQLSLLSRLILGQGTAKTGD